MRVQYKTTSGQVDTNLQYIIVYKPQNNQTGELIMRIYSPAAIEPPVSHGSYGLAVGFINDMPAGQKIPPFIAEIRGTMKDTNFIYDRIWTTTPTITISLPKTVPDFNLRPKSWLDKYVKEPIFQALQTLLML